MSLADQSQQWFPTSVQVTVHQARNLRIKGKNGTNDAYAIIQVAKDKFSTSVSEKCVAPVWKEEASFDLPLFHPGNAERCTLYIIVMHRAQVGLDKFLGQAVVNLLDLHDNNSRKKTDWYKLVDKTKKEDKPRGEVLLDIQFMRNNMSASMFDLSMQDKPRSRISKLKDKVRGKKKDGFSDSASAVVPSVNQVLTDSEGEADAQSLSQSPEGKKKSKLKTLFVPKSNLQRNISQSMSTLGTFPEKNSSLSGSRSSGLNVDSPEVKKKFKFLGHKRTGSSDSKVSQGPFSLLGRSKQSNNDLNNLCINGSHVYAEEAEARSGSMLSLNSSGQGSVEDVRKHTSDVPADSSKSIPVPAYRHDPADRAILEQQRHQEEEEKRQAEERRIAEAKRLEEEEKRRAEAKRLQEEEEKRRAEAKRLQEEEEKRRAEAKKLQEEEERRHREEQEKKRRLLEDEARRKKQKEEEEERRKQEEERRMREAAEAQRLEEECRREEQYRQEEASMSERLTSLFGMIRKKDEKKDHPNEEIPVPAPRSVSRDHDQPVSHHSTNPFEDIFLSSDSPISRNESPADHQKTSSNPQIPSALGFLNRSAKVSAVKPRFTESLDSESGDCQTPSQPCPSPANSTFSSVPSESPDTFSSLHSSLAPRRETLFGSPRGSTENLSLESPTTMAEQKRKAPLPPTYQVHGTQTGGTHVPVREIKNPAYVEVDGMQDKKVPLPLPDYETLFPQKRHGVQGQTRWDHIIAEVNQRNRDSLFLEMSVDGPVEHELNTRSSISQERPTMKHHQTLNQAKPVSSKKEAAPAPPQPITSLRPQSKADSSQILNKIIANQSVMTSNPSAVPEPGNNHTSNGEDLPGLSRDGARKALLPPSALRPPSQIETTPSVDQRKVQVTVTKEGPTAKPRQKVDGKESVQDDKSPVPSSRSMNTSIKAVSSSNVSSKDKKDPFVDTFTDFNPFPSTDLLPKDPWTQPKQNQELDELFTGKKKEVTSEDEGMTDDVDNTCSEQKPDDPFSGFIGKSSEYRIKDDDSKQVGPVFQRKNSQRTKKILPATPESNSRGSKSHREVTISTSNKNLHARHVMNESATLQSQVDEKAQDSFYDEEDLFGAEPFTVPTALSSSEPLPVVIEEQASQAGGLSGGKTLLRAWVSPSEIPPVSAQNSNGGGLALTSRRPHAVKPLSSVENQHPTSAPAVREVKVRDIAPGKIKVLESVNSGPYTQLTQEELITLVVKQQTDLTKKDAKIVELEEYIDNLLVRVIEEKPSILQALNAAKPV